MLAGKKYLFFVFCALISAKVSGQAASSPFTSFGLGEQYSSSLAHNQGMGGIGVSQPQFWFLNNSNPALLVYNTQTVFTTGILGESRKLKNDSISEKHVGGNMNYLAIAFPVRPRKPFKMQRWTTAFGLMPYSTVDYNIEFEGAVDGNDTINYTGTEQGSGGLAQFYWSNGVRINEDIAVGIRANYIFSTITYLYKNILPPTVQPLNLYSSVEESTYIKDFAFSLGLSYSKDSLWAKNYRLSFGLTYDLNTELNSKRVQKLSRLSAANDTVESYSLGTVRGSLTIPAVITGGVSLGRDHKWSIGTEFTYQDWSAYKNFDGGNDGLKKSWRYAFGGEVTPDFLSENYLKRITYRAGASVKQYPFIATPLGNKQVKDFGINFGFSLPTGRSSVDFGFTFGKRGNKSDDVLEERYFKIFLGLSLNDQWFIRRKFD